MISIAVIVVCDGAPERLDVELAVGALELAQVQRRQVARRVVEEHVLGARVRRVDPRRVDARVPVVDRRVELHARIAAVPGGLGDLAHQVAGREGLDAAAVGDAPVCHSRSRMTAFMNSSVTRTEWFAFWKYTES